jgi:hypothetical protein
MIHTPEQYYFHLDDGDCARGLIPRRWNPDWYQRSCSTFVWRQHHVHRQISTELPCKRYVNVNKVRAALTASCRLEPILTRINLAVVPV